MKMGLVYSQGIVFGLNILPDKDYSIGDDVTDIIGIRQMEEEENTGTPKPKKWFLTRYLYKWGILKQTKNIHSKFPEFLSKTDETRLQAIPEVLDLIKGKPLYITAKLDVTSTTFYCVKKRFGQYFGVCSRNQEVYKTNTKFHKTLPGNVYYEMAIKYDVEKKLKQWCKDNKRQIAVQGETIGLGVQENRHHLKDKQFCAFQVIDIDKKDYVDYDEFIAICKDLNLQTVPVLNFYRDYSELSLEEWIALSDVTINLDVTPALAEGIVVRPLREERVSALATVNNRLSFKVINPEYLVKWKI
jgi:RNA ligase (TIGR02306 family)